VFCHIQPQFINVFHSKIFSLPDICNDSSENIC
jgi:hypothetical protein